MGNCATRPVTTEAAHCRDGSESQREAHIQGRHKPRRSSLGRLAEFLSQQSSVLQDRVSADLPSAAERGSREVVDLVKGPGYLDPAVWCAGLDVPVVKARATALEKAVDTLLSPLIRAMEWLLSSAACDETGQAGCWQDAGLREFYLLLPRAAKMNSGVGLTALSLALKSIFTVLHALSQCAANAELPILPEIFQIGTVNQLMNMVGSLAAKSVDGSSCAEEKKRWQDWELIAKALSLDEEKLLVCLGAQAKALLFWMHGGLDGRPSIEFQVRREATFEDAFLQAQSCDLLQCVRGGCLLSVGFVDAVGPSLSSLEAGSPGYGPRKEFFLLAGQAIVHQSSASSQAPLFLYNRWAARYWFNTKLKPDTELEAKYTFAGWLLGQSMCNRTTLGVAFPELLFAKLLMGQNFKATVEVLQEFDVEAAAAVRGTAALKEADWKELLRQEGLDMGMKRRAYIKFAAYRLLVQDVQWQFAAFAQGFYTALDYKSILRWNLTPADLEDWASGVPEPQGDAKIEELFRVLLDTTMVEKSPKLGYAVLQVVNSWPQQLRMQFVAFVTGLPRPCHPKMETLRIGMPFVERSPSDLPRLLQMLPQAHTCNNMLQLPDYWAALVASEQKNAETRLDPPDLEVELFQLVDERLQTAVTSCCTYELAGPAPEGLNDINPTRSRVPSEISVTAYAGALATQYCQENVPSLQQHTRHGSNKSSMDAREEDTEEGVVIDHVPAFPKKSVARRQSPSRQQLKLGQPQRSDSPVSAFDSIPAIRGNIR